MTDIDLEPIKARLEAATDGPWEIDPTAHDWAAGVRCLPCQVSVADTASVEIAEFIAHAPEDIDALVAEVERLRGLLTAEPTEAEVEAARDALSGWPIGTGYYATAVGVDDAADMARAALRAAKGLDR